MDDSFFSRGHATLHLAMSVGRSIRRSVRPSVTFLISERFLRYCSCPTVRDWIAVYPALFLSLPALCLSFSLSFFLSFFLSYFLFLSFYFSYFLLLFQSFF